MVRAFASVLALLVAASSASAATTTFVVLNDFPANGCDFVWYNGVPGTATQFLVLQEFSGSPNASRWFWLGATNNGGSSQYATLSGASGSNPKVPTSAQVLSVWGNGSGLFTNFAAGDTAAAFAWSDMQNGFPVLSAFAAECVAGTATANNAGWATYYWNHVVHDPLKGLPTASVQALPSGWPGVFYSRLMHGGLPRTFTYSSQYGTFASSLGGQAEVVAFSGPDGSGNYTAYYVWRQSVYPFNSLAVQIGTGSTLSAIFAGSGFDYQTTLAACGTGPPDGLPTSKTYFYGGLPITWTWSTSAYRFESSNGYYLQWWFPYGATTVAEGGWYLSNGGFSWP